MFRKIQEKPEPYLDGKQLLSEGEVHRSADKALCGHNNAPMNEIKYRHSCNRDNAVKRLAKLSISQLLSDENSWHCVMNRGFPAHCQDEQVGGIQPLEHFCSRGARQ